MFFIPKAYLIRSSGLSFAADLSKSHIGSIERLGGSTATLSTGAGAPSLQTPRQTPLLSRNSAIRFGWVGACRPRPSVSFATSRARAHPVQGTNPQRLEHDVRHVNETVRYVK